MDPNNRCSDSDQRQEPASRKRFRVVVSGNTNGAHRSCVHTLTSRGLTEVGADADCDYVLVFCPVASRVGTDVSEALSKAPAGKPIVLVVMHHTFDSDYVAADSRRLVADNPNVQLTVDCLFHEGRFLDCSRNEAAWYEISNHMRLSQVPRSRLCRRLRFSPSSTDFWTGFMCGVVAGAVAAALVAVIVCVVVKRSV